jgi:hypothetical protein
MDDLPEAQILTWRAYRCRDCGLTWPYTWESSLDVDKHVLMHRHHIEVIKVPVRVPLIPDWTVR